MNADNLRIDSLFLAAVAKATSEERSAYLDAACGSDQQVRERVERLLAAHPKVSGFLESPALGLVATIDEQISERPGTVIGPYKLLEQIGEGGFGVVFMAEQTQPVRRKVALKLIKPGMDTRQVIARFEAERQALALMEHPNIARVLDAGTTDGSGSRQTSDSPGTLASSATGRPYFVMELVRGQSMTEYCDQHSLPVHERLQLFIDVCQAVQHAHQKGIIHRDIKPSNVLVTRHDGKPVVKVIDFGIAKAMGQQLTEKSLFTNFAQMIGTPLYMSPEQAEMSGLDVDTRSDIYSLGVLLYELLTGTTPFCKERLKQAGFDEIRRIIREEEPPKPSTRMSTVGQAATTASEKRQSDSRKLSRLFRSELDWIVMKALEKDRNCRYETANAFAADVQRYLDDEPVKARPPSAAYRLRKFARRNKGVIATASGAALVLMLAVVGLTVSNVLITREKDQKDLALQDKETALGQAQEERERAEKREAETRAVLEFVEGKIFALARPQGEEGGLGHEVTLRRALEEALPFVAKSFSTQPLIEARLRRTLGLSFGYLGEENIAVQQFQAARTLYTKHRGPDHPDTLATINNLANSYAALGNLDEALKLLKETLTLRQAKLAPDHPDVLASMNNLANCYDALGQHTEALSLREATLALQKDKLAPDDPAMLRSMNNLAISYAVLGRHTEAVKLREETLALQRAKLVPDYPRTLAAMNNLAESYQALGRHAEALKLYEETLALAKVKLKDDHPKTLLIMNNLAWLLATAEDITFRDPARAVVLAAKAAQLSPKNAEFSSTLGIARYRAGDWKQAGLDLEKTINLRGPDDSRNANESFFLAMTRWQLGDKPAARKYFDMGIAWMDKGKSRDDEVRRFGAEAAELLGIKDEAKRSDQQTPK